MFSVNDNQRLLSIACGGGHRTWDFAYDADLCRASFSYLKTHDVVSCTAQMELRQHKVLKVRVCQFVNLERKILTQGDEIV